MHISIPMYIPITISIHVFIYMHISISIHIPIHIHIYIFITMHISITILIPIPVTMPSHLDLQLQSYWPLKSIEKSMDLENYLLAS